MISGIQMWSLVLFLESLADNPAELERIRRGLREALMNDYRGHY